MLNQFTRRRVQLIKPDSNINFQPDRRTNIPLKVISSGMLPELLDRKLASAMYGESGVDEKAGVRKHVARIRERLEKLDMGVWIETAFGHGYRLVVKGFNDGIANKND